MSHESQDVTRRDFAKTAVAVAVAPVLAPLAACTATPSGAAAPAPTPAPAPAAPAREPTPLARALAEAVRVQYGDRMTEEEMATVARNVAGTLQTAERLRRFPLPIAAEPAFVYVVPGGAA